MLDTMSWPLCWAVDECSIYIHIVPGGITDGFCRYMYMYVSILGVMCTVTIPPPPKVMLYLMHRLLEIWGRSRPVAADQEALGFLCISVVAICNVAIFCLTRLSQHGFSPHFSKVFSPKAVWAHHL